MYTISEGSSCCTNISSSGIIAVLVALMVVDIAEVLCACSCRSSFSHNGRCCNSSLSQCSVTNVCVTNYG